MKPIVKQLYFAIEYIALFFGVPLFLWLGSKIIHPTIVLLPLAVLLIFYFRNQADFSFKDLNMINISSNFIKSIILIITLTSILLAVLVSVFAKSDLFNLPKRNPVIWIVICLLYPIFSAYLQEFVFRVFLFQRYNRLFSNSWVLIAASGIAFSFAHIIYFHFISIILSFILGIYLGYLYNKTKSVLLTALIHGYFGDLIFTIGLGQYFWLDMYKFL